VRRIRQHFAAVVGDVLQPLHGLGYRLALP